VKKSNSIAQFLMPLIFLVCSIFSITEAFGQAPQTNAKVLEELEKKEGYVCPPCGHDCLKTIFEKAGACGACGMQLADIKSVVKQLRKQPAEPPSRIDRKKVAILIFDGVQIIDFTGPYEVFVSTYEVYTVAKSLEAISTNGELSVNPAYNFENCPEPDILLIPGGQVFKTQSDPVVLQWLRETAEKSDYVLSVCNGAFILAKAGLLKGLTATTTRPLIEGLAGAAPNIKVVHNKRFVDNGKIITSGGLSAGIDAALHVVAKIEVKQQAESIAYGLEYDWRQGEGLVLAPSTTNSGDVKNLTSPKN